MRPLNDLIRELTTWGTPACGLLCGVLGAIAALLCVGGVFLGGVKDKQGCIRKAVNKVFPPRNM